MRHRKAGVKLNRTSSHKDAMFRNMVTSLFKYERIRTTDTKAKELRRLADKMISLAKRGDLHARRQAMAVIREKDVVHKLFEIAAERFKEINGGYTRILKVGTRPGDAASMSFIELVNLDSDKPLKKKSKKAKKAAKESQKAVASGTEPVSKEKGEPASEETVAEPVAKTDGPAREPESSPDAQDVAVEAADAEVSDTSSEEAAALRPVEEAEDKPDLTAETGEDKPKETS